MRKISTPAEPMRLDSLAEVARDGMGTVAEASLLFRRDSQGFSKDREPRPARFGAQRQCVAQVHREISLQNEGMPQWWTPPGVACIGWWLAK
jgi:hypothetical protein